MVELTSSEREASTDRVSSQDEFGAWSTTNGLRSGVGRTESETKGILAHRDAARRGVDLPGSDQEGELLQLKKKSTEREECFSPATFTGVIDNIGR